jgi:4-hydroxy-tetrahydrodipicolinate synthase
MAYEIASGVWPTMVTPYRADREIDYEALEAFVDWLVSRGVAGLFAACKSSEMFELSLRERLELSRAVVALARGRVGVVSSGHVAWSLIDQLEEAKAMADTGTSAVVLITNRLAAEDEGDEVFRANLERFLEAMPADVRLGLYECPYPYKRVLSPEMTRLIASTGRFDFLKDTCCDIGLIRAKLAATKGSSFRIFNANSATLLESLRSGAAGYSGVMANFHPELYAELCRRWKSDPPLAEALQAELGMMSVIEMQSYPLNAMHTLVRRGIFPAVRSRMRDPRELRGSFIAETEQMNACAEALARRLGMGKEA